jgi:hypothetical protein
VLAAVAACRPVPMPASSDDAAASDRADVKPTATADAPDPPTPSDGPPWSWPEAGRADDAGQAICPGPPAEYRRNEGLDCRAGRAAVVYGNDEDVTKVDPTPRRATIAQFNALYWRAPAVGGGAERVLPLEGAVYRLDNVQVIARSLGLFATSEGVMGLYMRFRDPRTGDSFHGYIPYPGCAGAQSPFRCAFPRAREIVERTLDTSYQNETAEDATVIGIPHLDYGSGQLSLWMEPILAVCFGRNCDPGARWP